MVFSIVESASVQLQNAQLILAKPRILLLAQKPLSLAQGMMSDLTVYGVKF